MNVKKLLTIIIGLGLVIVGLSPLAQTSHAVRNQSDKEQASPLSQTQQPESVTQVFRQRVGLGQQEAQEPTVVPVIRGTAEGHLVQLKDTTTPPPEPAKDIIARTKKPKTPYTPPQGPAAPEGLNMFQEPMPPPGKGVNQSSADAQESTERNANDIKFQIIHDMSESGDGIPYNQRSSGAHEPSVSNGDNKVFYTANWYAARSMDAGQNFTYINPYNAFPNPGGGFCCDQLTEYAPAQDMMIWALQYVDTGTTGTLRIARSVGNQFGQNIWKYYDFRPQMFGFPNQRWFDFPNMSVSSNFLYITSNVFTSGTGGTFAGSVVWRIPLAELAAGGPSVNFAGHVDAVEFAPRLTEGALTTMYWGTWINTTQMRIYRWADAAASADFVLATPTAFPYLIGGQGLAPIGDGTNMAGKADSRILAGYVARGIIGFMFHAKQNGAARPYPYTVIARFTESTRAFNAQQDIFHANYAVMYPSVGVNASGDLGGLLAIGGNGTFPTAVAWIVDTVSPTFVPLNSVFATPLLPAGVGTGPPDNRWGDYFSVHRQKSRRNSWVGSTFYNVMSAATGLILTSPRYIWFGRARDLEFESVDFDGQGTSDPAVFRPSQGTWYYLTQTSGGQTIARQFGTNGDKPVPADFDGDLKTDITVFRPSNGSWYSLQSSNGAFAGLQFGANGDLPVPGDFDGDGMSDVCVWRPSNGGWYAILSSNGSFTARAFGTNGDVPLIADFEGDGRSDLAVFRPSNGTWYWILSSNGAFSGRQFGTNGDKPVAADFDADGKTDIAVFRPSNGTWYLLQSSNGAFVARQWGTNGDRPVAADYEGDFKADFGVWRPSNGTYYVIQSSNGALASRQFGTNGDIPIQAAYVP